MIIVIVWYIFTKDWQKKIAKYEWNDIIKHVWLDTRNTLLDRYKTAHLNSNRQRFWLNISENYRDVLNDVIFLTWITDIEKGRLFYGTVICLYQMWLIYDLNPVLPHF